MAYAVIEETIGTATRDFTTVALWEDANDDTALTAGDGRSVIGIMQPDSIFTEVNTVINFTTDHLNIFVLKAAKGAEYDGRPSDGTTRILWQPTSGSGNILVASTTVEGQCIVEGIDFSGAGYTANDTLVESAGNPPTFIRCAFRDNGSGGGLRCNGGIVTVAPVACIAYDNSDDGFLTLSSGGIVPCYFCGAYNNGGFGWRKLSAGKIALVGCWGYNNTNGNVEDPSVDIDLGFNSLDDATSDASWQGSLDNQVEADAKFTDAPNGDFRIQAGSSLLLIGPPAGVTLKFVATRLAHFNLRGISSIQYGDSFDIGPDQFSHVAVVPTTAPVIS